MAKVHRPQLNSWILALILTSVGLHGLVLALPMPDLAQPLEELPERSDPEVIQVVTLPKLVTAPESLEPPLPEPPPPPPPLPVEESIIEAPLEELVLSDPDLLDELELPEEEEEEEEVDDHELDEAQINDDNSDNTQEEPTNEPTLEQRLANLESYNDYTSAHTGTAGEQYANGELFNWIAAVPTGYETDLTPENLTIPPLNVPVQDCFQGREPNSVVAVGVLVAADGTVAAVDGNPQLLGSTGYSVLNEKALEVARDVNYPSTESSQAYTIKIKVDYTRCS